MKNNPHNFEIDEIDWVRAAIANGMAERMTIQDLWACAEHARTCRDFDTAVNLLANMEPAGNSNLA